MMFVGISCGFHDAGISIVSDTGNIVYAGHSERYSKKKHDANLCYDILEDAASYGKIDTVAYYENHWLKKLRQFRSGEKIAQWDFSLRDVLEPQFKGHENLLYQKKLKQNISIKLKTRPSIIYEFLFYFLKRKLTTNLGTSSSPSLSPSPLPPPPLRLDARWHAGKAGGWLAGGKLIARTLGSFL